MKKKTQTTKTPYTYQKTPQKQQQQNHTHTKLESELTTIKQKNTSGGRENRVESLILPKVSQTHYVGLQLILMLLP